jgi:hypothetical protein
MVEPLKDAVERGGFDDGSAAVSKNFNRDTDRSH